MTAAGHEPGRSRRQEAQLLAEELLGDVELRRHSAVDVVRKASRLARLLDDASAISWLGYEARGYPTPLDAPSTDAAVRSGRDAGDGKVWTASLGTIQQEIATLSKHLEGLNGPLPNGDWALRISLDRAQQIAAVGTSLRTFTELLDHIVGAVHTYISERYHELRFGAPRKRRLR